MTDPPPGTSNADGPLSPGDSSSPRRLFRWQALLQHAGEPLFVLDRRRRLLFVNQAWEEFTGLTLDRARGLPCRQPIAVSPEDTLENLLAHIHTPPPEVLQGRFTRIRRLFIHRPVHADKEQLLTPRLWDLEFLPVLQAGTQQGYLIIGRILPVALDESHNLPPLPERLVGLRQKSADRFNLTLLESKVPGMHRLVEQVRMAAQFAAPILIRGEPGTGKETVARIVHQLSLARETTFIGLKCRLLSLSAILEVLPGRPGVRFHPGTIYLADPDRLPREAQQQLVEFVTHNPSAARSRIMVGFSSPPEVLMQKGVLQESFYWRFSTFALTVPAIKERLGDLPALVQRLIARFPPLEGQNRLRPTNLAMEVLMKYPWPGNLRELRQVITAACKRVLEQKRDVIDLADLPFAIRVADQEVPPPTVRPLHMDDVLAQVERRLITQMLSQVQGNRTKAAEMLGVPRTRFLRRLEALGITSRDEATLEDIGGT